MAESSDVPSPDDLSDVRKISAFPPLSAALLAEMCPARPLPTAAEIAAQRTRQDDERRAARLAAHNRHAQALATAPHPRLRKLIFMHRPEDSIYSPEYVQCNACPTQGDCDDPEMWPCLVYLIAAGEEYDDE